MVCLNLTPARRAVVDEESERFQRACDISLFVYVCTLHSQPDRIEKLEKEAARNWNKFYKNNTTNFFKDRHYLGQEMPELLQACEAAEKEGKPPIVWMEVGSGVGNAVLPLLETVKNLHVQTMDCSRNAVELLKKHPSFEPERCVAHVCDIALEEFVR